MGIQQSTQTDELHYPVLCSVYNIEHSNIGDIACCPFQYFRVKGDGWVAHHHVRNDLRKYIGKYKEIPIVVGGGGLFKEQNRSPIKQWLKNSRKTVVWGAGTNQVADPMYRFSPSGSSRRLIGMRDVYGEHDDSWVPCCSCLHPLLDRYRDVDPTHDVVVYEGWSKLNTGYPTLSVWGQENLQERIRFLSSGGTVVSSSYHGAYWATLLGRKVAVMPAKQCSRFYNLAWKLPMGGVSDIGRLIAQAKEYPSAMTEARSQTLNFSSRVEDFLGIELTRCQPSLC